MLDKCHHNIIFGKLSFKIPLPPPYTREVWNYGKANVEGIQRSISGVEWDYLFQGTTVHKKVEILNETLKNIFRNFIPNRTIKCDYRQPQWMTKLIRDKLKKRSKLTKIYFKNGKTEKDLDNLNIISNECTKLILDSKEKHVREMSEKLNDCLNAPKTYWKILNHFLNNIKIPSIPPLLVNGEMVSNFLEKAELFNKFFASQCSPVMVPVFFLSE